MGCGQSKIVYIYQYPYIRLNYLTRVERNLMEIMMPMHYTNKRNMLTDNEIQLVRDCWTEITTTSITLFYDTFYGRMFDINVHCKHLFRGGMKIKSNMLIGMMTMLFDLFTVQMRKNNTEFNKRCYQMAESHNSRGINMIDYILLMDSLCWTFVCILSPDIFTENMHNTLIQMFNEIFTVIFPLVVLYQQSLPLCYVKQKRCSYDHELCKRTSSIYSTSSNADLSGEVDTSELENGSRGAKHEPPIS
jgi:hemoglobin-like flavoprotein